MDCYNTKNDLIFFWNLLSKKKNKVIPFFKQKEHVK